jgi:Zn-dependent protease
MFLHRIRIFTLAGFTVWIDASWLIFAALITWTLAAGIFPTEAPSLPAATYWWMGVAGAIGLFFSIVVHELSHSLVARRFALPINGITLFIFGGVAELHREPASSKSEFWMAIAGPACSIVLGVVLLAIASLLRSAVPRPIYILLSYLGSINLLLAAFNLVPAFPLDGGRVLRSALWAWKDDYVWATRVASASGDVFGILLIVLGGISVLRGNFINGIWLFLIGMFLHGAAGASRRQMELTRAFSGRRVSSFITPEPPAIPPDVSLKSLVENYFYRHHHKIFPILRDGRLTGCVTVAKLREIGEAEWEHLQVSDASEICPADATISPDADALDALTKMQRSGRDELLVVSGSRYLGILSLTNMLHLLAIRRDLSHHA